MKDYTITAEKAKEMSQNAEIKIKQEKALRKEKILEKSLPKILQFIYKEIRKETESSSTIAIIFPDQFPKLPYNEDISLIIPEIQKDLEEKGFTSQYKYSNGCHDFVLRIYWG